MFEISKLKELKLPELQEIAEKLSISKFKSLKKLDLVYKILDHQADNPTEETKRPPARRKPIKLRKPAGAKKPENSSKTEESTQKKLDQKTETLDVKEVKKVEKMLLEINLIQSTLLDLDLINTTIIVTIIEIMVIKTTEIDIANLNLNLMLSLKVRVF